MEAAADFFQYICFQQRWIGQIHEPTLRTQLEGALLRAAAVAGGMSAKPSPEASASAVLQVPGGWLYQVSPGSPPVYVPDPSAWVPARDTAPLMAAVIALKQEISTMSTTLSQQIDDATAKIGDDLKRLTAGVGTLNAELAAATSNLTPGSTVTQAQVDALNSVQDGLDKLASSLPASAAATDATDATAATNATTDAGTLALPDAS